MHLIDQDRLGENMFKRNANDEKRALSIEDNIFLEAMDNGVFLDVDNHWVAPFRSPRTRLPNNKDQAMKRLTLSQRRYERTLL